jgi:hypothetical protein
MFQIVPHYHFLFQLNAEFKDEENPNVIYAISMTWFKEWENFVRGKTDGKCRGLWCRNRMVSVVVCMWVVASEQDSGENRQF